VGRWNRRTQDEYKDDGYGLCALWLKFAARKLHKCLPFVAALDGNGKYQINIISNLGCISFLSCRSYLSAFFVSLVFGVPFKCLLNPLTAGIFLTSRCLWMLQLRVKCLSLLEISLCLQIPPLIYPQARKKRGNSVPWESESAFFGVTGP